MLREAVAVAVTPEQAFDQLYQRSGRRLVGQLYAATGDLGDAQDVVQEAFVRAWLRWEQVAAYENPEAWVRRVAMNLAVSRWRRTRRLVFGAHTDRVSSEPAALGEQVALVDALRSLPARQRQAVVLHHLGGLSVVEVAVELNVPEGTVKSWLSRGRSALAVALGEGVDDE
jgi:RNA polymerase sigma-70 factor, ECF subfamily